MLTNSFNGKLKKYSPNKISMIYISKAFGKNTDDWVNKIVELKVEMDKDNQRLRVVAYGTENSESPQSA